MSDDGCTAKTGTMIMGRRVPAIHSCV